MVLAGVWGEGKGGIERGEGVVVEGEPNFILFTRSTARLEYCSRYICHNHLVRRWLLWSTVFGQRL